MYAGDREVVFGLLLARVGLNSSRRATRDLVLPEEGHHEGLFGARTPPAHQPDPACGQRAVWGGGEGGLGSHSVAGGSLTFAGCVVPPGRVPTLLRLHVEADAQVAAGLEEPVVGGRGDVKGQPALLSCSHRLHIQQHQLRLSDGKKPPQDNVLDVRRPVSGINVFYFTHTFYFASAFYYMAWKL